MDNKIHVYSCKAARYLIVILLMCMALAACGGSSGTSNSTPAPPPPTPPVFNCVMGSSGTDNCSTLLLAKGSFNVGFMTGSVRDTSRATPSVGTYPGSNSRTFKTYYWYPVKADGVTVAADNGLLPLIVYLHGFGGTASGGDYLADQLASLGYFVASFDQVLTSANSPTLALSDAPNIPGDVSFLIDTLLNANSTLFQGVIDAGRIGVIGHSLGGGVAMQLGYDMTFRDDRIRLVVGLAPLQLFFTPFGAGLNVPLLIMFGNQDEVLPYESGRNLFELASEPKNLATLINGTHLGFVNGGTDQPGLMTVERQHDLTILGAVTFIRSYFDPDGDVRAFMSRYLNEGYAVENKDVIWE